MIFCWAHSALHINENKPKQKKYVGSDNNGDDRSKKNVLFVQWHHSLPEQIDFYVIFFIVVFLFALLTK